jgi:TetR/AcrR family transcriptional regulator, cholesterol catabolism regulator
MSARPVARTAPRAPEKRAPTLRKARDDRWEELLATAADIFYEKGYDAASLQDIAERIGIHKGSIYYYIKTKSDLRDNLLLEVHNEGIARIRATAAEKGNALTRLDFLIRGHIEFLCTNLAKSTVYLNEIVRISPAQRTKLFGGDSYRDEFQAVFEAGQREGYIASHLDPKLASQAILGSLNAVYRWYRPTKPRNIKKLADHYVEMILQGHASAKGLKELSKS